jgi:tetrahydromethanopterin S-methyltransferase subunit D
VGASVAFVGCTAGLLLEMRGHRRVGLSLEALSFLIAILWASAVVAALIALFVLGSRLPAANLRARNEGMRTRAIAYDAGLVGLVALAVVFTVRAI